MRAGAEQNEMKQVSSDDFLIANNLLPYYVRWEMSAENSKVWIHDELR